MANENPGVTSAEARASLESLATDDAALASRVVTPWWYHVTLGAIAAVFTGSQALPGAMSIVGYAVGIVAIPVLVAVYRRRYGLWFSEPVGPRSRRALLLAVAALVVPMLASLVLRLTGTPVVWILVPAAIAFVATIVLGRRFDVVTRDELAHPTPR